MNSVVENFKKYRVPLSDNMDVEDLTKYWQEVEQEIRAKYSSVTGRITAINSTFLTAKTSFTSFSMAKKAYDTAEQSVLMGAAVQQMNTTYPQLTLQVEGTEAVLLSSLEGYDNQKPGIL